MSDERLRDLERRWRETGADEDAAAYARARERAGELVPADEVALLRARLQRGDLHPARAAQAALLGHAAAARALQADPQPEPLTAAWLVTLGQHGAALQARVALALARAVQPAFTERLPADERVEEALAAAEQLLAEVDDPARQARLGSAVPRLVDAVDDPRRRAGFLRAARCAACAALGAAECVALHAGLGILHWDESPAEALRTSVRNAIEVGRERGGRCSPEHLERLRVALLEHVVPWLLTAWSRSGPSPASGDGAR